MQGGVALIIDKPRKGEAHRERARLRTEGYDEQLGGDRSNSLRAEIAKLPTFDINHNTDTQQKPTV